MRTAALLLSLVLPAASASAQDAQYWNLQYGPVAELLGGVVVGSTRDLSATFYNPGALALAKNPSLVASVSSFEAARVKATADAPVIEFDSTSIRPSPSLFAVALPRRWTGSHTLAFSALTRQDFDMRIDNWVTNPSGASGAEAMFDQDMSENWFGLTWSHGLGRAVGIGLTNYVAYRGQRVRRELTAQAARTASNGAAGLMVDEFSYSNYRLLWKAGLARQGEAWDVGITVTTPSVRLLGTGEASYTRSLVSGEPPSASVSIQHEADLDSSYRSPWSVALGGAHRRGQSTFHAAAEWFAAVPAFDVLDTSPFAGKPGSETLVRRLRGQAKSLVNFGAGYERRVSDRFSWYGALTTDFTFSDEKFQTNALSTWNIYHVTAGTAFVVANAKLTVGASYAFGGDTRMISMLQVPPDSPPVVADTPLDIRFSRLRVLVGFDFGQ